MSIRDEETEAAEALEATGNYRVLRRIPKWINRDLPSTARGAKVGLVVDVETTGLDYRTDQVIELAAVLFSYDADGNIYTVSDPLHCFNDPGLPIPPEVTRLTGITQDMVAGQKIDSAEFDEMCQEANFILAFNAAFDRCFVERLTLNAGTTKPWGCAMAQVPWAEEGIRTRQLESILAKLGWFYDAHRAVDDCLALVHLLAQRLPSGEPVLNAIRRRAIVPTFRVWAEATRFEWKEALKARQYRWHPEAEYTKPAKAWYRDVDTEQAAEAEKRWLAETIYQRDVPIRVDKISIFDRFSVRG